MDSYHINGGGSFCVPQCDQSGEILQASQVREYGGDIQRWAWISGCYRLQLQYTQVKYGIWNNDDNNDHDYNDNNGSMKW